MTTAKVGFWIGAALALFSGPVLFWIDGPGLAIAGLAAAASLTLIAWKFGYGRSPDIFRTAPTQPSAQLAMFCAQSRRAREAFLRRFDQVAAQTTADAYALRIRQPGEPNEGASRPMLNVDGAAMPLLVLAGAANETSIASALRSLNAVKAEVQPVKGGCVVVGRDPQGALSRSGQPFALVGSLALNRRLHTALGAPTFAAVLCGSSRSVVAAISTAAIADIQRLLSIAAEVTRSLDPMASAPDLAWVVHEAELCGWATLDPRTNDVIVELASSDDTVWSFARLQGQPTMRE